MNLVEKYNMVKEKDIICAKKVYKYTTVYL